MATNTAELSNAGKRYRRRPLEVTAVQVREPVQIPDHPNDHMTARPGDWIIASDEGGLWVCEEFIFPLIYEEVVDG